MTNQYVGDINDYRKYDLMQILSKIIDQRILVVWMLTNDDGRNDGNKIKYLKYPKKWEKYNETLFNELKKIINENNRNIKAIQDLPFFMNGKFDFYSKLITDDKSKRDMYFKEVDKQSDNCKILFFDPDNGISVNEKQKNASKYLFWSEIINFWNKGKDILVFQYFPWYCNRSKFIQNKIDDCSKKLNTNENNVITFYAKNVLYLLLMHDSENVKDKLIKEWEKWLK